jgi:hypothetical protein
MGVKIFVQILQIKLSHYENQIRPLKVKTGHHPALHSNGSGIPQPFLNGRRAAA